MKLALTLPTDVSIALRKLAAEHDITVAEAAELCIADVLIELGLVEDANEIDEDTETEGEA